MLIRYYITSVIIWLIIIVIGEPLWALIPWLAIIVMTTGSIQSHQTSIQSVQQFTTDNIMLLSWLMLMFASIRMMYLSWYDIIIATICVSIITIIIYYISLWVNYSDGIIIRHQASIIGVVSVSWVIIIQAIQQLPSIGQYAGILTIFMTIVAIISTLYVIVARSQWLSLPDELHDEIIILRAIIIPIGIIMTVFGWDIIWACALSILLYIIYAWWLWKLKYYYYPITNPEEITVDLILKWYKTAHISQITRWSWINSAFHLIKNIKNPTLFIIQRIPDILMAIAYIYFIVQLLGSWIRVSDFIVYCIIFILYSWLPYLYKKSNTITIDTTAQSFIFGYLSITSLMITIFTSDPISGSIVGIIRVVINALIVSQYNNLNIAQYLKARHVQRRVRANTAWAIVIVAVMVQLPIDSVMIIPLILIVIAILGFTIAQSYITLRTIK